MTPSRLSGKRAIAIGCLMGVCGAAATVVVLVALVVHWWNQPVEATPVAPPFPQPPSTDSWHDGAGLIVDVTKSGWTGASVRDGVYLVTPETGQYEKWSGASTACHDPPCFRVAASHDALFGFMESGESFSVDAHGTSTALGLFDAGAPELNTHLPIAVSWDGKFLAYSTRDEDLHDLSVVVDVLHGKVAHSSFPHIARSAVLALSPDGSRVVYGTPSGLAFVDTNRDAGAQEMRGLWGSQTFDLAWSPNGKWVLAIVESAAGPHAKDLWVIDAATHDAHRIAVPEPKSDPDGDEHERVLAASFSPDGTSIAVLSDIEGICGHPKIWAGCECDPSLYRASVTGTDWKRMSATVQGCGHIFWLR